MAEEHDTVRGLVLAGGGAKGSYQVGVYQALMELGWLPDVITGASVGSLNAALFVMGKVNEAADLWRSLDNHGVLELPEGKTPEELRDFLLETLRGGGLNTEPLGQTIDQYMDENAIRASHIKYGLVITEMNTLRSVQCTLDDIPQGQLKDYMLASSACFPALRPYEIDGVKYIDGGWRDNMPLELAAKMGATELIGVDVDGVGLTRPNLTGLPTRIIRSHWDLGPLFDFDGVRAAKNIALGFGHQAAVLAESQDGYPGKEYIRYRRAEDVIKPVAHLPVPLHQILGAGHGRGRNFGNLGAGFLHAAGQADVRGVEADGADQGAVRILDVIAF